MSLICCLVRDPDSPPGPAGAVDAIARACSPRVQPVHPDAVTFDASGLARVLGPPSAIADAVQHLAAQHAVTVRVALAATATTAWLLAHARSGVTVAPSGRAATVLAPLPVGWLQALAALDDRPPDRAESGRASRGNHRRPALDWTPVIETFARWGVRTLGDIARLPRADLLARLGPAGRRAHEASCGEDVQPLVPAPPAPRFCERLALEWPIDNLEPLSFVLARLCDALEAALERADRGAVAVTSRLTLVTRAVHERVLHLPDPIRDARVLRALILLDLESHPPPAGVDTVEIELEVTPGRIAQGSLLRHTLPTPETLATLVARLSALVGDTRVGAPVLVDTHDERAVGLATFRLPPASRREEAMPAEGLASPRPATGFRRFRPPLAARVAMEQGVPVRVVPAARGLAGGRVTVRAGPWRSSGRWWALDRSGWDRDEWDVALDDGVVYRLARDRASGGWTIEGQGD